MCMIGNLGNQVQQCTETPSEHEPRESDDNAKRSWDVLYAIACQPEDRTDGAEYNPDHAGDFQRPGPPGFARDFPRSEFGIVNAVAEVNHDPKREPVD